MRVVVMGIASCPEVQDVENVPSYAEWLIQPNYVALVLRQGALLIVHTTSHAEKWALPFNPSATQLMFSYRPELGPIHGNALVVGINGQAQLEDCPADILRLYEDHP